MPDRFDRLALGLAQSSSRRAALGTLGSLLAATLGAGRFLDAPAAAAAGPCARRCREIGGPDGQANCRRPLDLPRRDASW